ncbi:MAG: DUF1080 domain-containing protein [Acidobacteria bacterium]|nr:DUF1080 domain-containing protein [Acidobacteriota bacterium]
MSQVRAGCILALLFVPAGALVQGQEAGLQRELPAAEDFRLVNAEVRAGTLDGSSALRMAGDEAVLASVAAKRREVMQELRARGERPGPEAFEAVRKNFLAVVEDIDFGDGTIEVDLAGQPAAGAQGGARGFVGVAFRVQEDDETYDCFYVRPTNGRADDQVRRNHSAQYISHPEWTWFRLREQTPGKYETYVDIGPAEWIAVKIVVAGETARLYVNGAAQPTLIVNDLKSGAEARGRVALWIEGSTVAHFRNLRISPAG